MIMMFFALALAPAMVVACQWTTINPPPPQRFMSAAASSLGKSLAYVGGTFIDKKTGAIGNTRKGVITYHPTSNTWTTLPNMTTARSAPAAATLKGRLYVFGGVQEKPKQQQQQQHSVDLRTISDMNSTEMLRDRSGSVVIGTVESLAVSTDGKALEKTWKKELLLPGGPLESPSAVALESSLGIVIAGGFDSSTVDGVFHFQYYNQTWLFDGQQYVSLPDMPFRRSNMALVATTHSSTSKTGGSGGGDDDGDDDVVYAFGGGYTDPSYGTCASLRIPKTSTGSFGNLHWIPCSSNLVNPISWTAAAVVNRTIVLAGGMSDTFTPTAETDILSLSGAGGGAAESNWTNADCDLPLAVGFLSGAVTLDDQFVVVAGAAPKNGGAYLLTL